MIENDVINSKTPLLTTIMHHRLLINKTRLYDLPPLTMIPSSISLLSQQPTKTPCIRTLCSRTPWISLLSSLEIVTPLLDSTWVMKLEHQVYKDSLYVMYSGAMEDTGLMMGGGGGVSTSISTSIVNGVKTTITSVQDRNVSWRVCVWQPILILCITSIGYEKNRGLWKWETASACQRCGNRKYSDRA